MPRIKGSHLSEETKTKISLAVKGFHHTEEAKAKIRLANIGKHLSEETKAKLSRALKGRPSPLIGRHPSEEARAKMSKSRTGKLFTKGHKANLSKATRMALGRPEARAKMSLAKLERPTKYWLGKHPSKATRTRVSNSLKAYELTPAGKVARARHKLLWRDPEWRDKTVRATRLGLQVHPNKAEVYLSELLEGTYPGEWSFVGDGQLIIGGKNPDFANINGKKQVIELYGDYWHEGEDPQERIDLFGQYGFKTLIIWERELAKPQKVLKRIDKFIKGGIKQ